MLDFSAEKEMFNSCRLLGAIDEAGRGPLAGPVVAACVVCGPEFEIPEALKDVNDSKLLSEKKRNQLYEIILEKFADAGIGVCDHETIDRINILQASFLAMKKAIRALHCRPDSVILDGKLLIPDLGLTQTAIVDGDAKVFSIAAASIAAKVYRDRLMAGLHEKYPQYGFDRHKGYATKEHFEKLRKFGPCPVHRRSFAPVRMLSGKTAVASGPE